MAHSQPAESRASELFGGRDGVRILPAQAATSIEVFGAVVRNPPAVAYLVDIGSRTAAAALAAALRGVPTIVDTGDLVYELERSRGSRSLPALFGVRMGEIAMVRLARHVVVRGRAHEEMLRGRAVTFAPDLAPPAAAPTSGHAIRRRLRLDAAFVVGLVGSLLPAPRLGISYGWDVVEALQHTSERVQALVVGDGPARLDLQARARAIGVADRCRFVGAVPTDAVAEYIGAMDVAVSTQTNDPVGAVRTTGKLPLYLACGCPVLASDVGEARRLLGPLGWTIPYDGVVDRNYPRRLAATIEDWASDVDGMRRRRREAVVLHRESFDPEDVRARVWAAVEAVLGGG